MRAVFLAFVTSAVVSAAGPSPASANDYLYHIQVTTTPAEPAVYLHNQSAVQGDGLRPDGVLYGKSQLQRPQRPAHRQELAAPSFPAKIAACASHSFFSRWRNLPPPAEDHICLDRILRARGDGGTIAECRQRGFGCDRCRCSHRRSCRPATAARRDVRSTAAAPAGAARPLPSFRKHSAPAGSRTRRRLPG